MGPAGAVLVVVGRARVQAAVGATVHKGALSGPEGELTCS